MTPTPHKNLRTIKLVETFRTIVNSIAVGYPTKIFASGKTLEAAQAVMISKMKSILQETQRNFWVYKNRCELFEMMLGTEKSEGFSLRMAQGMLQVQTREGARETARFLAQCDKIGKPFPRSTENLEKIVAEFLRLKEIDDRIAWSSTCLMEIYELLLKHGEIK